MRKLLVANWKLNPQTEKEAIALARASDEKNVVICPPFLFASSVRRQISRAKLGAQDVFWEEKGAFTGEVGTTMLKSVGVNYAIIGHSERRNNLNETDEMVHKKIVASLKAGLTPIVCVGESYAVHKKGLAVAKSFVKSQLKKALGQLKENHRGKKIILAYEPIWAISTAHSRKSQDNSDTPENAAQMMTFIKHVCRTTCRLPHLVVLYGGSVNGKNAKGFLSRKEINGALVGGASLRLREFKTIVAIAAKIQ